MKGFFIEFLHIWFIVAFFCHTKVEKLTLVNSFLHVYQCKNNKPVLIWKHIQEIARNILHSFICNKFFLFLRNDNPNHCVFFVWNFYKNYFSSRCSFTMSSLCSKKTNKKNRNMCGFFVFILKRVYDACAGTGSHHGYLAHWQRSSPDGQYRYLRPLLEVSHILMLQ